MRWSGVVLMAGWVSGCSLLVEAQFKEPQPCEPTTGACDFGYLCSDAGLCLSTDAGPLDAGPADAGTCETRETLCGDTRDNDCDMLTDCADPDCGGLACDDRDVCTMGETCGGGTCMRGTAVVCNMPATCQNPIGACEAGTGRCVYTPVTDGTLCGGGGRPASRCCAGTCVDTSINTANCGGCGLSCGANQTCQSLEVCAASEPAATSGRCTCNPATSPTCPGQTSRQVCSTGNTCRPATNAQCAPGQSIADGGLACGTYCRYP
ncbi:MAG: hypothetical protein Q8L48_22670 [Archangium sp.]|nr:hypothetical protein [Archangium sp.]